MLLENRRLAVIEDDPIMGESLVQRLELEGASVTWWRSAVEAKHGFDQTAADAVICDIRLPDGSGEEIYREFRNSGRQRPFLFVTGFGDILCEGIEQIAQWMQDGKFKSREDIVDGLNTFPEPLEHAVRRQKLRQAGAENRQRVMT